MSGVPGGRGGVVRRMEAVDAWADRRLDPLRGTAAATLTASALSNLADYGLVWVLVAAVKGRGGPRARRRAATRLAVAGGISVAVNTVAKRGVGRARPGGTVGTGGLPVRRPTSSSFPSGHTLAAFCTAVVMADGPVELGAYLGFAASVAAARVHLRAHHASDVLGGAVIGTAAGLAGRGVVRRLERATRRPPGRNAPRRGGVGQA